jgi:predicted outer membrane repeat protein
MANFGKFYTLNLTMKNKIIFLSLFLFLLTNKLMATIVYVDSSHIGGTQNGTSWANAYANFQSGVNAASAGDSVWVAKGTYQVFALMPFEMKEGVKIFGGFLNTHTAFSQRDWQNNISRLRGNGTKVMLNPAGLTPASLLDGFTITNGGNTATGGGILNSYCSPTITNCTFLGNVALTGGGIANFGTAANPATPVITNCNFINNVATGIGGAIYNSNANAVIANCTFTGNKRDYNVNGIAGGGAIFNSESAPVIGNCTFTGNNVRGGDHVAAGGAIYNDRSAAVIGDCTFSDNRAICRPGSNVYYAYGGAIYNLESAIQIANCTFTGNDATTAGGGIFVNNNNFDSTGNILNCAFTGNKVIPYNIYNLNVGGGIYTENTTSSLKITDCSFDSNSTDTFGSGGGIFLRASSPILERNTFTANKAKYGGGMFHAASSPKIINAVFLNDRATAYGGAIYDSVSSAILVNCLLNGNIADTSGGAIYAQQSSIKVINSTLYGNTSGSGGSLHNTQNSAPRFINSIIWGNASGVENDGTSAFSAYYSLVQGYPANAANHNIDGITDPLFTDALNGDFQLQAGSPVINAGNNDSIPSGIYLDLTNHARIFSNTVDLGAYEKPLPPSVFLGNDTAICEGNTLTLNAGNHNATYEWSTGAATQTITVNAAGSYFVTVTDSMGTASDTIQVDLSAFPVVALGNDTFIASGVTLVLDAGNAGATYLWSTGAVTQTIAVSTSGTYSVTVTNAAHCSGSDAIKVTVNSTGVHEVIPDALRSSVGPNPADNFVLIRIGNDKLLNTAAQLMALDGRVLRMVVMKGKEQSLSLEGLAEGIYFIRLQSGETFKIAKAGNK